MAGGGPGGGCCCLCRRCGGISYLAGGKPARLASERWSDLLIVRESGGGESDSSGSRNVARAGSRLALAVSCFEPAPSGHLEAAGVSRRRSGQRANQLVIKIIVSAAGACKCDQNEPLLVCFGSPLTRRRASGVHPDDGAGQAAVCPPPAPKLAPSPPVDDFHNSCCSSGANSIGARNGSGNRCHSQARRRR